MIICLLLSVFPMSSEAETFPDGGGAGRGSGEAGRDEGEEMERQGWVMDFEKTLMEVCVGGRDCGRGCGRGEEWCVPLRHPKVTVLLQQERKGGE